MKFKFLDFTFEVFEHCRATELRPHVSLYSKLIGLGPKLSRLQCPYNLVSIF